MLSPDEREKQVAQQALEQAALGGGAGPMLNATQAVQQSATIPSSPSWADYLGGIQQVQQAGPGGGGQALPIAGGTKTLARLQFEESIRQFNEQMAYKRAVAAAQASAAARAARMQQEKEQPVNERALLWDHIRGVVDDAVGQGRDWSYVNQYITSNYGHFPKDMPFDEVQQAAFTYYDQKAHPGAQAWQTPQVEDDRNWLRRTWDNLTGQSYTPPVSHGEDIDALRHAYYGDKYGGW